MRYRRGAPRSHPSQQLCNAHDAAEQTGPASPSARTAMGTTQQSEARPCFRSLRLGISPARGVPCWCGAGAEPDSACCWGDVDLRGVRGTGSSPATALYSGCYGWRLGPLPPPAPILVLLLCHGGRAQPGPSLSFHFYTTVCRSDAFIAKQLLEWRLKRHNIQYVGSEVCLSDSFS